MVFYSTHTFPKCLLTYAPIFLSREVETIFVHMRMHKFNHYSWVYRRYFCPINNKAW